MVFCHATIADAGGRQGDVCRQNRVETEAISLALPVQQSGLVRRDNVYKRLQSALSPLFFKARVSVFLKGASRPTACHFVASNVLQHSAGKIVPQSGKRRRWRTSSSGAPKAERSVASSQVGDKAQLTDGVVYQPACGQKAEEMLLLREDKCHRVESHEVGKKKDVSGEVATKQ